MQQDAAATGLMNVFNDDMWGKIASNPKLAPYLADPVIVNNLKECQKDYTKMSR